MFVLS